MVLATARLLVWLAWNALIAQTQYVSCFGEKLGCTDNKIVADANMTTVIFIL